MLLPALSICSHASKQPGIAEPFIGPLRDVSHLQGFLVLMSDGLYEAFLAWSRRPTSLNDDLAALIQRKMDRLSAVDQVAQVVVEEVKKLFVDTFRNRSESGRIDDITLLIHNLHYPVGRASLQTRTSLPSSTPPPPGTTSSLFPPTTSAPASSASPQPPPSTASLLPSTSQSAPSEDPELQPPAQDTVEDKMQALHVSASKPLALTPSLNPPPPPSSHIRTHSAPSQRDLEEEEEEDLYGAPTPGPEDSAPTPVNNPNRQLVGGVREEGGGEAVEREGEEGGGVAEVDSEGEELEQLEIGRDYFDCVDSGSGEGGGGGSGGGGQMENGMILPHIMFGTHFPAELSWDEL